MESLWSKAASIIILAGVLFLMFRQMKQNLKEF